MRRGRSPGRNLPGRASRPIKRHPQGARTGSLRAYSANKRGSRTVSFPPRGLLLAGSAAVSLSLEMVRRLSTRPVAARCQRRNRRASRIRHGTLEKRQLSMKYETTGEGASLTVSMGPLPLLTRRDLAGEGWLWDA